eukprot:gene12000-16066_t
MSEIVCPSGFDCSYLNSCPKATISCPNGYFCGSYEGFQYESRMNYQYSLQRNYFQPVTVTRTNYLDWVDSNRAIQSACLKGFYCPSASEMKICPEGYYCPEGTKKPIKCDAMSICPENSGYQINFINTIIGAAISLAILLTSFILKRNQQKKDNKTRNTDPNGGDVVEKKKISTEEDSTKLISINFSNIRFMGRGGRVILPSISGNIPAGKITALLGPTSCGKSTLLNVLRNGGMSATSGEVSVAMLDEFKAAINQNINVNNLSKYIGYVPQEDILDRDLTVRELLMFNALIRIPGLKAGDEADALVDRVLADLSIAHVADSVIGGGENVASNISGGQLKRVNIACELVVLSRPAVLLLDEPTAGLDASIAFDLMETLRTVATKGITIMMVLQQPRAEIFNMFDNLLLMSSKGDIIFEGQSEDAVPYFRSIGYEVGEETADADFCLDILNGIFVPSNVENSESFDIATNLSIRWSEYNKTKNLEANKVNDGISGMTSIRSRKEPVNISWIALLHKYSNEVYLNAHRMFLIRMRNMVALFTYIMIAFIMAVALSSGFSIYLQNTYLGVLYPVEKSELRDFFPGPIKKYRSYFVTSLGMSQLLFFISSTIGTAAALAAGPVFAGQLNLIRREVASGTSLIAYTVGRLLTDIIVVILIGFVFTGTWLAFGHAGHFYDWIATILSTTFASSGIGYITGVSAKKNNVAVYSILTTFICAVFAGVEPTLRRVNNFPIINWPWYLSFGTYAAE